VDDIAETRENVRKLLLFEKDIEVIGAAPDGQKAIEMARQLRPDIILMDINMTPMDGITAAEIITNQVPESQIVMMSVQGEADYLRRSMLAGAREFLIKPFTGDDLVNGIRRVHELGAERRARVAAAPVAPTPEPEKKKRPGGIIVTVFSPKGGTGRTTIAVNLAVALRAQTNSRVALVDCSLQFGDVGVALNLQSTKTIADLVTAGGEELDADLIDDVMLNHSSGIKVLLAPARPEMAELVTGDHLKRILTKLRLQFDYVIVDTWPSFHDQMLVTLDLADRILLITVSELSSIKNTKLFFEVMEALHYSADKIILVLNRADSRLGISPQDIQRSINHPIAAVIPSDGQVTTHAINHGVPFVLSHRDSAVAKSLYGLAQHLAALKIETTPAAEAAAAARPAAAPQKGFKLGRLLGAG